MAFMLNKNDLALLASVAENRVLTVAQIAAVQGRRKQVIRRRLRELERAGLTHSDNGALGRSRGRPEKQISLTKKGAALLCARFPALREIPNDRLTADKLRCVDHQVAINWFKIHLRHMEHVLPELSVRFVSNVSPFRIGTCESFVPKRGATEDHRELKEFAPDGVFSISHESKGKTLLFFLEVDMGTESIASVGRGPRDLRQKILNYQHLFQEQKYKFYETSWHCHLAGFRLLFLTTTGARMAAICNLIQSIPPSGFIWVTTLEQMFSHGLSGKIWVRGGRSNVPKESILGSEMAAHASIIRPKD